MAWLERQLMRFVVRRIRRSQRLANDFFLTSLGSVAFVLWHRRDRDPKGAAAAVALLRCYHPDGERLARDLMEGRWTE
jgi:hypothetical protein